MAFELAAQMVDLKARLAYLQTKLASADANQETMLRLVALLRGRSSSLSELATNSNACIDQHVSEVQETTGEERRNALILLVAEHTGDSLSSVQSWSSEELINSVSYTKP